MFVQDITDRKEVEVRVTFKATKAPCPECGAKCKKHDSVERRWRHLDMWDYQTWIVCRVPRSSCEKHGVKKIDVPWADGWARFTAQFECVAIDWLKVASMTSSARNLGLTWDQVNGIQERAVRRGLKRREALLKRKHPHLACQVAPLQLLAIRQVALLQLLAYLLQLLAYAPLALLRLLAICQVALLQLLAYAPLALLQLLAYAPLALETALVGLAEPRLQLLGAEVLALFQLTELLPPLSQWGRCGACALTIIAGRLLSGV